MANHKQQEENKKAAPFPLCLTAGTQPVGTKDKVKKCFNRAMGCLTNSESFTLKEVYNDFPCGF